MKEFHDFIHARYCLATIRRSPSKAFKSGWELSHTTIEARRTNALSKCFLLSLWTSLNCLVYYFFDNFFSCYVMRFYYGLLFGFFFFESHIALLWYTINRNRLQKGKKKTIRLMLSISLRILTTAKREKIFFNKHHGKWESWKLKGL